MRLKWKSVLALTLSATMMISAVPLQAQTVKAEAKNITQKVEKLKGTESDEKDFAEGEAIVLYNSSNSKTKSINTEGDFGAGIEIKETYDFGNESSVAKTKSTNSADGGFSVSLVESDKYTTEELISILEKRADVKYAEPNYRIKALGTNDIYSQYQWALENIGQNGGTEGFDINADIEVMQNIVNDEEKVIALVDTGIDYTHEDLQDVVWENPINSKQLKGEHGYDFISYDEDPLDDNGHGTHCSGIMVANPDNETGIAGVANSDNIKIMALKILDAEGFGYGMEAVGAYNYIYKAQQLGINVVAVNNSWGASIEEEYGDGSESEILLEVINMVGEAGAISVCASGNEGVDNEIVKSYPACLDSPYIISVAASNENDELAAFSNYGNNVDIAAPGTSILSTVSYDVFNPSIYENRDELCSVFENFEEGNLVQTIKGYKTNGKVAEEGDIAYGLNANGGKADMSVNIAEDTYFGQAEDGTKSIQWTIEGAQMGDIYTLYLPYESKASETTLHSSVMAKVSGPTGAGEDFFGSDLSYIMVADGEIDEKGTYDEESESIIAGTLVDSGNYWNHFSGASVYNSDKSQKRAIAVYIMAGADGDFVVNIDKMGVSKPDVESEAFGKYDFYNGTSMAAPHVTAAVAAVANSFENETALERKARIVGSTRKSDELWGLVSSGGTLDFANIENPGMSLETATMNDKNQVEIKGYYLEGAEVLIDGKTVTPIKHTNNLIVVEGKDYIYKSVYIEVIKDDDYASGSYYFMTGKSFDKYEGITGYLAGGSIVSGAESLYYVDRDGYVNIGTPVEIEKEKYIDWVEGVKPYTTEIFGDAYKTAVDYTMTNNTDVVCVNKKLYTVLSIDVGFAEDSILAQYDEEKGWQKYADLPSDFAELTGITLTSYNGNIYLIGGLNEKNGRTSKQVKCYDEKNKNWTQCMILPEGRAFAKAMQVGNKLVVTLGANDTEEVPKALIYDGNEWKVSKAELGEVVDLSVYSYETEDDYYDVYYASAQIGLVKNGIVFTDLKVDGLGDTFTYDVVNDKYVAAGYCLNSDKLDGDQLYATTVKDKLYVLYGWGIPEEDFELEFWKKQIKESYYDDYYSDIEFDLGLTGEISVCTMPVTNGYICVNDKSTTEAYVNGAGYYLPGDTINLTAEAYEGFYVKSFTVDGKKVNADSKGKYTYTAKATGNVYTINAVAESGDYFEDVTEPPAIQKGSKVTVGKFTYKVTSITAKKKTVTVVSFNNKKKATKATVPATVMINGTKFKVTAIGANAFKNSKKLKTVTIGKNVTSIGKNAFRGCKNLKKVTIKATKIKKFGKNLFKGTNKKLVVKVPKKSKKSYKTKLKKAGFTGKVK